MSNEKRNLGLLDLENCVSVNTQLGVREQRTPRNYFRVEGSREEENGSDIAGREEENGSDIAGGREENGSDIAGKKEKVTWVGELHVGDAISFRRKLGLFKYKHHGIVEKIIPGTTRLRIIHVTGASRDVVASISSNVNTGICSEVIDFKNETDIFKYTFHHMRRDLHNPARIANIFLDYGLPKELGFHLLHFNCESFSRYCATGIVYSKQTGHYNKEAQIKLDAIVRENVRNYI